MTASDEPQYRSVTALMRAVLALDKHADDRCHIGNECYRVDQKSLSAQPWDLAEYPLGFGHME